MALNIGKKVYRNLQEQVSWLTTTVEEIIDITNPAAIKAAVEKIDAFQETLDSYDDIMAGYAETMGGYATTMEGYALQVDTWTNNISAAALQAITGQDVSLKTLDVDDASKSYDTGINLSTSMANLGLTGQSIYSRMNRSGGRLSIIINYKITNPTDSPITIPANSLVLNGFTQLSDADAAKVFDLNGVAVSDYAHYSSDVIILIATMPAIAVSNLTVDGWSSIVSNGEIKVMSRPRYKRINIDYTNVNAITIAAGASRWISGRIILDLFD